MILSCQNVSKAFATKQILKEVSFNIEEKEKAAIVGINGAGKSTILKIIMNQMERDSGEVTFAKGKTIGYLAQHQDQDGDKTIYDELLEVKKDVIAMSEKIRQIEKDMKYADKEELEQMLETYSRLNHQFELENGYAYQSEITGVLKGLGFAETDFTRKVGTLSGGQKTRVALGKLLLSKPDLILLDEPTNHLDMDSVQWLETFLLNYNGAVLIVSHDRYFLDKIVSKIIELEFGESRIYHGNYSYYVQKHKEIKEVLKKQYANQQREIKHQEDVITKLRSFNREKSIKRAESREKMLDKIDVLDKPKELQTDMRITLEPQILSGTDVIHIENLSKSFDDKMLFSDIAMDIQRGERVALIGNNGTGKTTILKIINKVVRQDTGKVALGSRVHIGYYDQEYQVLSPHKTIFDELSDAYPVLTQTKIRSVLAAFLFMGDDVFKRISDLSGGERGRVSLAKLMLSSANFLILDEPTNHLDIHSKEVLEDALQSYTGTVLYVSHDRYFINQTATRIVDLTPTGLINYKGNYDYYIDEKAKVHIPTEILEETTAAPTAVKNDWKKEKEEQARLRKQANDLKKCEELINDLEIKIEALDQKIADPANGSDVGKLMDLSRAKAELEITLEEQMALWEELAI